MIPFIQQRKPDIYVSVCVPALEVITNYTNKDINVVLVEASFTNDVKSYSFHLNFVIT